jgi:hypothetical protein
MADTREDILSLAVPADWKLVPIEPTEAPLMAHRNPLGRVKIRPSPDQWGAEEPVTLAEAIALFFPNGPLTISSLRNEIRKGTLAVARVAGKDWTTPASLREMIRPCRAEKQNHRASGFVKTSTPPPGSSSTAGGKSAQAAAKKKLKELRAPSATTSPRGTKAPSAHVIPLNSRSPTS